MIRKTTKIYDAIKGQVVTHRRMIMVLVHILQILLANYLAFSLRFDFAIPQSYAVILDKYLLILIVIRLFFYLNAGLQKDLWRYSSVNDLAKIVKSVTFGSIAFFLVVRYGFGDDKYPRSVYALDWLLLIMISGGSRFMIRVFREYMQAAFSGRRILVVGAGDAGEMIVRDMKSNRKYAYEPVGFIDDDPAKKGHAIHGVPIIGPRSMIAEAMEKYNPEEVLIAIPSADSRVLNDIYEQCKPYNVPIKTLPSLSEIIQGKVSVSHIKPLSLEDLLQREPVSADLDSVKSFIAGKRVLVTGAGGSIGSELSRQIVRYGPSQLIMFDRYENGLFDINLELSANGTLPVVSVVGDIRDRGCLEVLFSSHRPEIVFHAAAHKHVPLMELNPLEAVKNNILGTRNVIAAASRHGVGSFVMISTDKAVNPVNIMGATKRVAEYLTMSMNGTSPTRFTVVRFGNVLGSNGSVVQIFREQLRRGGPLTVTHPGIKRFFMLIPEAVHLVLIAAASGKGGDIFVLDMGEQIRITDLAENLIRLSGYVPHEEIRIEYTGLRPGEKLSEELFDESEKAVPAFHEKLMTAVPEKIPSVEQLSEHLDRLDEIIAAGREDQILPEIRRIVPNYRSRLQPDS